MPAPFRRRELILGGRRLLTPLELFGSQLAVWVNPLLNTLSIATVAGTGTISQSGTTTVTGVGTLFISEARVGDRLTSALSTINGIITAIASNTSLTLDTSATGGGLAYDLLPQAGVSDRVTTILGLDPLVHSFTQATFAKKPSLCATIEVAGATRRKFKFDGITDGMVNASAFLTGTAGAVYASYQLPTGAIPDVPQTLLCSSDEASTSLFLLLYAYNGNATPNMAMQNGTDAVRGNIAITANNRFITRQSGNGIDYFTRINNVEDTTTVILGTDSGLWFGGIASRDNVTIGMAKRTTEFFSLNGFLDTIVVLDGRLPTAAEDLAMYNYLASVW